MYAHSILMVPQSKADQTSLLYFHCSQCKQRKPPKIRLLLEPPTKRKEIGTGKSKALADTIVEVVGFFVWTCQFQ